MHRYLLHNRELRDASEACLSPGQVGFLNGWGIFSTLRVSEGVLFAVERHYARLRRDADRLHVQFDLSAEELYAALQPLIKANGAEDAVLRVAIVRNKGGLFEGPGITRESDLIAFTADRKGWGEGARLRSVAAARLGSSPLAGTKTTSWAQNLTWLEEAQQLGFDESLLLNEHGDVSECTSANVFAILGNEVWTPPLATSGCLPGVTREILLKEIKIADVRIAERVLTRADLAASDCVFLTSTTRDLLPVLAIDKQEVGSERAVWKRLREAFLKFQASYIRERALAEHLVTS